MMRSVISLICLVVLCALPAHAGPGFLKKIGRAVATHKLLVAETLAVEVLAQFDIHSSEVALRRCPDCTEGNFLLPARPTGFEFQGEAAATTLVLAAGNWYLLSIAKDSGCPATDLSLWCKKGFWTGATLGTTAEFAGLHAYGAVHNNSLQP